MLATLVMIFLALSLNTLPVTINTRRKSILETASDIGKKRARLAGMLLALNWKMMGRNAFGMEPNRWTQHVETSMVAR